jgi:hypothetical protein
MCNSYVLESFTGDKPPSEFEHCPLKLDPSILDPGSPPKWLADISIRRILFKERLARVLEAETKW